MKNNSRGSDLISAEICKIQRVSMRLLRKAGREKDWELAEAVLEERLARPDSAAVVDLVMHNVAINVFAKCNKWEKALEVLARMKTVDGGVRPDVVTYNAVMDACGNGRQGEKALELLREMQAESVVPDATNFNMAMNACVTSCQWEQASGCPQHRMVRKSKQRLSCTHPRVVGHTRRCARSL